VQRVIAQARDGLRVRTYNINGAPIDGGLDNSGIGPLPPGYVRSPNSAAGASDPNPAATSPPDAAPPATSPSAAPQNTGN